MISVAENISVHPCGKSILLEAHHGYNRTRINRTAFVTSRQPISSGCYELICKGSALLRVYAYQYTDSHVDGRSDAFEIRLFNETLVLPCEMLCHSTKTNAIYTSARAAFQIEDMDGILEIKCLP